jgi:hypothetical protein
MRWTWPPLNHTSSLRGVKHRMSLSALDLHIVRFNKETTFCTPGRCCNSREGWKQERQLDYKCWVIRGLQHASLRPAAFDWTASKDNQTGHNNKEIHINSEPTKFWFPTYHISRAHIPPSAKWLCDGLISRHRVVFCTPQHPNRLWSPPTIPANGYRGLFPQR